MGMQDIAASYLLAGVGFLIGYIIISRAPEIKRNDVPLNKPPNTLPLVGNGIWFLQPRQKLFSWFVECERQFGYETFQITVPTLPPGVVINDPRNLEYVFKNEGTFSKGEFVKRRSWDLFGYGIINVDGEMWKAQRKAGLSFLNTSNMRVLTEVALPKYLRQSVQDLKDKGDKSAVDMQAVYHDITSQLMGKMAYNMEMHANDAFTVAFDYASGATAERFQNPLWFITEIALGFRFRSSVATVKSFGRKIVANAMRDRQNKDASNSNDAADERLDEVSGSLIQSLLDVVGKEDMVADAALNYLSAGRDTVAQALTWTTYLLMKSPSTVQKIREEVEAAMKSHPSVEGDSQLDFAALTPTSLPYIMAVFNEALRLYPPVPFEIKQCDKATTLPDGTFLPEESVVVWCPWAMNRSKITWGEDADDFRAERWLVDGKLVAKSASEFPVFNGGPRTCLGKRMAEIIAMQVIATMVWQFDFAPAYETERTSKSSLTLPMSGGLPCYVRTKSHNGK